MVNKKDNKENPVETKLKTFGLNIEQIKPLLQPLIAEATKEILTQMDLPGVVQRVSSDAVETKLKELVAQFKQASNLPSATATDVVKAPAGGGIDMAGIAQIVRMFGMGGDQTGLGAMAQMATALGTVMKSVLEPVMGIYSMGQKNALEQITALGRTGGPLPWERKAEETK